MNKAARLAVGRAGRQQKPLGVRRVLEGVAIRENRPGGIEIGEVDSTLREAIGRIGREGEQAMLSTTNGVNTHRGAIWALGLLTAAAALEPRAITLNAARLALLNDRYARAEVRRLLPAWWVIDRQPMG